MSDIDRTHLPLAPRNLNQAEEDEPQERYLAFAQHIECCRAATACRDRRTQ